MTVCYLEDVTVRLRSVVNKSARDFALIVLLISSMYKTLAQAAIVIENRIVTFMPRFLSTVTVVFKAICMSDCTSAFTFQADSVE